MTTTRSPGIDRGTYDAQPAAAQATAGHANPTFPVSTRSLDMYLLHEELARAQISERHAHLAQSFRLQRLAAARRRERRQASARRRVRLVLAPAR
jgi:hypothetical protein